MSHTLTGRTWVVGDSVDTDALYPGFAMRLPVPEAATHVLYDLRPGWSEQVRPGDILVAGRNFGIGSSRQVAALLRHLGITALVAEDFNSLFHRNAVNHGLPAVTVPGVRDLVTEGDTITLDLEAGLLRNGDTEVSFSPVPPMMLEIIDAGGLLPRLVASGHLARPGGEDRP
ncbi:3-isopropylmalate dehydratase [Pseudonocardia alni]|uniref:LeuD/DmdB family oxidoreductase small subunit n=1 Tax=Pseudonocardia alni TaxID=33907 RepID=UPI003326E624